MIIFIAPGTASQIVVAMFLSIISISVYVTFKPYRENDEDALAVISQMCIFFTLLGALLIRVDAADNYDSTAFGVFLIVANLFGVALVFLDHITRPFKWLLRVVTARSRHDGTLLGLTEKEDEEYDFLDYFERLAMSDSAESGFKKYYPRGSGWMTFLTDSGAKIELRNSLGNGSINEGRLTFVVDEPIEVVECYLANRELDSRPNVTNLRIIGMSTDFKRTLHMAQKSSWFLTKRDYLIEEFHCDAKNGGKIIARRAIFDEMLFNEKLSQSLGFWRADVPLSGYLISRSEASPTTSTKVVILIQADQSSFCSEAMAFVLVPRALRRATDELLDYSFSLKLGKDTSRFSTSTSIDFGQGVRAAAANVAGLFRKTSLRGSESDAEANENPMKSMEDAIGVQLPPKKENAMMKRYEKYKNSASSFGRNESGVEMSEVKSPLKDRTDSRASAGSVSESARAAVSDGKSSGNKAPLRVLTPIASLDDVIGVPLPPSDWEGYKDPKYKAQKVMKKREDDTIRRFNERKALESLGAEKDSGGGASRGTDEVSEL